MGAGNRPAVSHTLRPGITVWECRPCACIVSGLGVGPAIPLIESPDEDKTLSSEILQVFAAGPTTIVGFHARDALEDINVVDCRDDIIALVEEHNTKVICFELSRVRLIPSGLLGLLASLRQMDLEVRVLNPSEDVRDVLSITNFDKLIVIEEVELDHADFAGFVAS